ncbi:MAG: PDC sensor domain-containing protein [Thermoanaerobaculia bacterium]|nr:PDC sensor domain-containing protein [Thermoanaerobaculia bacterium]
MRRFAFVIALLVPVSLSTTGVAVAQESTDIVFEDDTLPARAKDLLTKYARQIRTWGMIQRIVEAAAEASEETLSSERLAEIEAEWAEGGADRLVRSLQSNDCAEALESLLTANAGYADAFVVDRQGTVVCMSRRAPRYSWAEIPGWDAAISQGKLFVTEGEPGASGDLVMIRLVVPVLQRGEVVGALAAGKLVPEMD